MKIDQHKVGSVDVLTPSGPLVDDDGRKFSRILAERADAPSPRVVVCLAEVPYMDSSALEGIVAAADRLNARAGSLKVAAATATCREILELTGVAAHLRFFRDVQDAVRSYL